MLVDLRVKLINHKVNECSRVQQSSCEAHDFSSIFNKLPSLGFVDSKVLNVISNESHEVQPPSKDGIKLNPTYLEYARAPKKFWCFKGLEMNLT